MALRVEFSLDNRALDCNRPRRGVGAGWAFGPGAGAQEKRVREKGGSLAQCTETTRVVWRRGSPVIGKNGPDFKLFQCCANRCKSVQGVSEKGGVPQKREKVK
jgi:hypothetical protein